MTPLRGAVRVGGVDVRRYDLEALRDQVAVVLQKNVLFSGSIRENLRWGNKDATDAEMEEACRLAQADEFIRQFPDGYDTISSRAAPMFPEGRSSACALPARC